MTEEDQAKIPNKRSPWTNSIGRTLLVHLSRSTQTDMRRIACTRPVSLTLASALATIYGGLVIVANLMSSHFGLLPIGFGLMVTAGTLPAGAVLVVRNQLQETTGRPVVLGCIVVGAFASWRLGAGTVAVASGLSFFVSESLDMAIYTALRADRRWKRAVVAGTWVGAAIDTFLFLNLAHAWGALPFTWRAVAGQLLVKAVYMLAVGLPAVQVIRRAVSRQRVQPSGA